MFNPLYAPEGEGGPEQTGGSEEAPIVAVEEAAVVAAEAAKAADEAKAKEAEAAAKAAEGEQPKPQEKDWRDKELAKKHAQLKEKDRREAELQQRIKDLEELAAQATSRQTEQPSEVRPAPVLPTAPKMDDSAVQKAAAELRNQEKFNEACVAAEIKGKEVYKDEFEKSVENIRLLGGFDPETMVGILATDDPSKVLYELGKNPNEYHRIMELAPAKRIAEMTKMAMTATPKPKLSEAPAPVDTVNGHGGAPASELRDDLSDDEWNRIRDEQEHKRWLKKQGRAA